MFTIFPWLNVIFSCFKQSPLNFTLALVPTKFNEGSGNLLDVVGVLIPSSGCPLDFHNKIILGLLLAISKYLWIGWNTNQFSVPSSAKWLLPRKWLKSNVFNLISIHYH